MKLKSKLLLVAMTAGLTISSSLYAVNNKSVDSSKFLTTTLKSTPLKTTPYIYKYSSKKVSIADMKKNIGSDHFIFKQNQNTTIKNVFDIDGYYFIKGVFKIDLSRYGKKGFVNQPFQIIISKDGKVAIAKGTLLDRNQKIIQVELNLEANKNKAAFTIGHGKKSIFIFTDPDCPYCVQLSKKLKNLKSDEYTLYVYFYPLDRLHPNARKKSEYILSQPKDKRLAIYKQIQGLQNKDGKWKTADTSIGKKLLTPMIKYEDDFVGVKGTPYIVNAMNERINLENLFKSTNQWKVNKK